MFVTSDQISQMNLLSSLQSMTSLPKVNREMDTYDSPSLQSRTEGHKLALFIALCLSSLT